MFQKILVAYDGSAGADRALDAAVGLARRLGARLCAVAVAEHLPQTVATIDEAVEEKERADAYYRRVLERARLRAAEHGATLETELRAGHPARTIVDVARSGGYDLVVMGHSGHSQAWTMFLGTTVEKVSRHAPCSILIVR